MIEIRISINVIGYFYDLIYVSSVVIKEAFRTLSIRGREVSGSRRPVPPSVN